MSKRDRAELAQLADNVGRLLYASWDAIRVLRKAEPEISGLYQVQGWLKSAMLGQEAILHALEAEGLSNG